MTLFTEVCLPLESTDNTEVPRDHDSEYVVDLH